MAGCYVQDGVIARDCQIRLLRDNIVVFTGKLVAFSRSEAEQRVLSSRLGMTGLPACI